MLLNLATVVYGLALLVYGAMLRTSMRERFGIQGAHRHHAQLGLTSRMSATRSTVSCSCLQFGSRLWLHACARVLSCCEVKKVHIPCCKGVEIILYVLQFMQCFEANVFTL